MKRMHFSKALWAGFLTVFIVSSGFMLLTPTNGEPVKGENGSKNKTAQPVKAKDEVKCGPSYNVYDNGDFGIDPAVTSVVHTSGSGAVNTYTSFPAYILSNGASQIFTVNFAGPTVGGAFRVFNPFNGRVYTCQNIPAGVTSATFNVSTPTCATLTVAINGAWDTCP